MAPCADFDGLKDFLEVMGSSVRDRKFSAWRTQLQQGQGQRMQGIRMETYLMT